MIRWHFSDPVSASIQQTVRIRPLKQKMVFFLQRMGSTLLDYPTGKRDTSYAIPNGVVTVGGSAFIKNTALQQVSIPATVTTIGDWAFARSGLTSLTIPDTVTTIGYGIAQECRSLVTAYVGNGVAVLPYRTFEQCTGLTTVTLGSNIKEFGTRIFFNCTALTSVNLPEGLENIDVADFWGCKSLTYLKVPSTVKKIEAGAFSGCTNLNVDYPSHLTQMEDGSYLTVETLYYSGNYHYDDAYRVLDIVNQERGKEGLAPLAMDESLLESAMLRAVETCLDFSHTRPTGQDCFTANAKASRRKYCCRKYICYRSYESVDEFRRTQSQYYVIRI